ncbi:MAG: hypothetical protein AB1567_02705 [bacterium]
MESTAVRISEKGYIQIPNTILRKEKLKIGDYLNLTDLSGILILQKKNLKEKSLILILNSYLST